MRLQQVTCLTLTTYFRFDNRLSVGTTRPKPLFWSCTTTSSKQSIMAVDGNDVSSSRSAFDTVDHDIMLSILHRRFSVEGVALKWFHTYLTDRSQTFSVGDSKSDCHWVSCCVPQGSVLGPVEFVAYTENVADLFDPREVNLHLYADYQHIYLHTETGLASTRLPSLAACFSDLSDWWRLQLNAAKTELICLARD